MIERTRPKLSVRAQCRLLSIARSSFFYEAQGETAINLALMRLIDQQFLETPVDFHPELSRFFHREVSHL